MPTTTVTGLTHIVLLTPKRRADLTLPEHVPLAHLHATLLRHGGEDLVEDGVPHGGWVVRRLDGSALDPSQSLAALEIHNGDVLLLSHRDQHWPEPSFDDVADGVADDATKLGATWQGSTSVRAGLFAGAVALTAGAWLVLTAGPPFGRAGLLLLGVATLLLLTATLLARLRGNDSAAGVLATFTLIYATLGGLLVLDPPSLREALVSWRLLASASALLLFSVLGLVSLRTRRRVFYAGTTLGMTGLFAALLATLSTSAGAAAGTAALLVLLAPLLPRLAALQGGLPTPAVPNPAHGQVAPEPMPRPAELTVMVRRADDLLSGVLVGAALVLFACVATLGWVGDATAIVLAWLVIAICGLRMRMFAALRHRLPLGLAALAATAALLSLAWSGLDPATRSALAVPALGALLLAAAAAVAIGSALSRRPPAPGLGRLADVVEVLCVIVTPVLACAVLGLFGLIRGLLNG